MYHEFLQFVEYASSSAPYSKKIHTQTTNTLEHLSTAIVGQRNKAARSKSLRAQARTRRRGEGHRWELNAPHLIRRVRAGAPCVCAGPRSLFGLTLLDVCCSSKATRPSADTTPPEWHGCIDKVLNVRFFLRESALSLARVRI